jgi:predicted ATPase/DNA-binding XRE family transcriptional regulator
MRRLDASFGGRLRRAREDAHLTQEELAERAGLSPNAVSALERGERRYPYPATVRALALALRLTDEEHAILAAAVPKRGDSSIDSASAPLNLPMPLTPLIGREQEVVTLSGLLRREEVRLVTLTGMGGIGKTRLAIGIASEVSEGFRDGVVFVDLAPLTEPAQVLPAIATALTIRASDDSPLVQTVISALRQQQRLLLLDNCEHLLPAMPDVAAVLEACPGLTVLATSREALRLRGEHEWPVLPLQLPDLHPLPPLRELQRSPAVALFLARAAASDPQLVLSAENARSVVTVCHRVEGIPLAIELAAARSKLLTPDVLAVRLEARLPLLTGGARDAPARQRTLRDALAWSYDLLPPEEQTLFRRLGVFVGGWTLPAAEAVANMESSLAILDGLSSLLDKSLIRGERQGGHTRYGMLETVREFALDQLARSGERDATREWHAAYFLAFAERAAAELEGSQQQSWFKLQERDYLNLREALTTLDAHADAARHRRLTAALTWYWYWHGPASDGLWHVERALARAAPMTLDRVQTLLGAGYLAYSCGAHTKAARWPREGMALAQEVGNTMSEASFAQACGALAEQLGDERSARSWYETSLALAQDVDYAWLIGIVLPNLSDAAYRRGELDLAERFACEAVPVLADTGNVFVESLNLANIAQVALARGDLREADAAFAQALRLAEAIDAPLRVANVMAGAGAVSAARGRYDLAARLLGAADRTRERLGNVRLPHFALFEQTRETVRGALGAEAFQGQWEAGAALSLEEAMAQARAVITDAHTARPVAT